MPSRDEPDEVALTVEVVHDERTAKVSIIGEADITNLERFRGALDSIELDGEKGVEIQVSELKFIDVASLRQLTAFARHAKETGHDVTTSGATAIVRRAIRTLNLEDDVGLS